MKRIVKLMLGVLSYPCCLLLIFLVFPLRVLPRGSFALLLQPTGPGSLGDEAMMRVALNGIERSSKQALVLGNSRGWAPLLGEQGQVLPIMGATAYPATLLRVFRVLVKYRPVSCYGIGADVMDGCYSIERSRMRLLVLLLCSAYCPDVRLLGFSFNSNPPREIVWLMRIVSHFVKFFARDPVSRARLEKEGIACVLVADMAFLLEPWLSEGADEVGCVRDWIARRKAEGKFVIGLNLNCLHAQMLGSAYLDSMRAFVAHLVGAGHSLVMIAHDTRQAGSYSDYTLMKCVVQTGMEEVFFLSENMQAAEVKYLAGSLDMVITGRMHFAIAAFGQSVPTLMFAYQGKQEGLARFFHLDPEAVVLSPAMDVDELVGKVDKAISSAQGMKASIESSLPEVRKAAERNFS